MQTLLDAITEQLLRLRIAYYEWALTEVHPAHPDVPLILLHVYQLRQRLAAIQRRFA